MLLDPPVRSETMLFFRLSIFQQLLDAPRNQVCKCFIHESDHSNGPEVRGGSCVFRFWKHLEHSFIPRRWYYPVCKTWFMMPRRLVTTLSGAKCANSAANPHSSKALFIFSRLMAPFNSCKLQFGSVKCNGRL